MWGHWALPEEKGIIGIGPQKTGSFEH